MVTTVVIFAASMLLGECRDLPPSMLLNSTVGNPLPLVLPAEGCHVSPLFKCVIEGAER